MKVFAFDPTTGRRGQYLREARRPTYADFGVDYSVDVGKIKPIEYTIPEETKSGRWTAHVDAGCYDKSYLTDQWICFCSGKFSAGPIDEGQWEWIVLPPKNLIVEIKG